MDKKPHTFQIQGVFENIDKLSQEAESGNFEASQRLESIRKLANPIFEFSPTDYRRILDKKLPLPVRKGIELYKMMNQLTYLVQPIGKRKGTACSVRRVEYENLTWEEFLDLRGSFSAGFIMEAMKQRAKPNFEALSVLSSRQKDLYQRIKVYFGLRKRPTLQSLAMNMLSEETDGKEFSERSLYIYQEAIKEYRKKRKKAAGFDVLHFTFHSVTSFGNEKTIRESLESWDQSIAKMTIGASRAFAEIGAGIWKDMLPRFSNDLVLQFQFPKIIDMVSSAVPNLLDVPNVPAKDTSD